MLNAAMPAASTTVPTNEPGCAQTMSPPPQTASRCRLQRGEYGLALVSGRVTTSIPLFVSTEVAFTNTLCRIRLFATVRQRAPVAVVRVKVVVHVAAKSAGTMKPGTGADEDSPIEPFRAVIAGWSTAVWNDVVISIGTFRGDPDGNTHLGLRCREDSHEAACDSSSQRQRV